MREVRHRRITAPDAGGHGLGMSDGQPWLVEDCVIDLSTCPLERLDEAVGVTWGSSAFFHFSVNSSTLLGKEETKLGKERAPASVDKQKPELA